MGQSCLKVCLSVCQFCFDNQRVCPPFVSHKCRCQQNSHDEPPQTFNSNAKGKSRSKLAKEVFLFGWLEIMNVNDCFELQCMKRHEIARNHLHLNDLFSKCLIVVFSKPQVEQK